jgi:nucleoid-associated protein YgaU
MTKLVVGFNRSKNWRDEEFIATGQRPSLEAYVEFDMVEASEEKRREIVSLLGGKLWEGRVDVTLYRIQDQYYKEVLELDDYPTLEETIQHLKKMKADRAETEAKRRIAEAERRAAEAEAEAERRIAKAEQRAILAEQRAAEAERRAAEAERHVTEAAAERQFQDEKKAWIDAHGSEHLRRAVARGHDCTELYIRERAKIEAPKFVVDIHNRAIWKEVDCPSVKALDVADEAEKLGLGEAQIVWLIARADDGECKSDLGEAVVVHDYLGKYNLVRCVD